MLDNSSKTPSGGSTNLGGISGSRGWNFQYACSLDLLLDAATLDSWEKVLLEGEVDIEDVTILNSDQQVVVRAQIKQKSGTKKWSPKELWGVLLGFSHCLDDTATNYRFIYEGYEGPEFQSLKQVLEKIRYKGYASLSPTDTEMLKVLADAEENDRVRDFLERAGARLELCHEGNWRAMESRDLVWLQEIHSEQLKKNLSIDDAKKIYNSVFVEIARKTEDRSPYHRLLTKERILQLLGLNLTASIVAEFDVAKYAAWVTQRAQEVWLALPSTFRPPAQLDLGTLSVTLNNETDLTRAEQVMSLPDALITQKALALVGGAGTGKTLALWQQAVTSCQMLAKTPSNTEKAPKIPVVINLSNFDATSLMLDRLCAAFQRSGQTLGIATVEAMAKNGQLLLLLDDLDLVRAENAGELIRQFRDWIAAYPKCSIVVTTQRIQDGARLDIPTLRLSELSSEAIEHILVTVHSFDRGDVLRVLNGLEHESQHLLSNPLTLHLFAGLYKPANKYELKSRAYLYQSVVEKVLTGREEKGSAHFDKSEKVQALSLLARWMQNHEQYSIDALQLSTLLQEWIHADSNKHKLAHLASADQLKLRTELVQSGFFETNIEGGIIFTHSMFRAYFAALSIEAADLALLVEKPNWRTSLLLWSSLRERLETDKLVDLLSNQYTLLGQVIRERTEKRMTAAVSNVDLQAYFERFFDFYRRFTQGFRYLLRHEPWSKISDNLLRLSIVEKADGCTLVWSASEEKITGVEWPNVEQLPTLIGSAGISAPHTVWLIPKSIIARYHPLELVYLCSMRSLFNLLAATGWQGGLDVVAIARDKDLHYAISLVNNRFWLYYGIASEFPDEITSQLPFYAKRAYDLAVEVHEYGSEPFARVAVAPSHELDAVHITPLVLQQAEDPSVFEDKGNGVYQFRSKGDGPEAIKEITSYEDVPLRELNDKSPGAVVEDWLREDMEKYLPGYPPEPW